MADADPENLPPPPPAPAAAAAPAKDAPNKKDAPAAAAPAAASASSSKAPELGKTADGWVGSCLCKKIIITVSGPPIFSGFCHCTICARHGGTDRALMAGWAKDKVKIDGGDNAGSFKSSEKVSRNFCKTCGAGVFCENENFYSISPAIFGGDDQFRVPKELAPQSHIYYGSSCLLGTIKDGSGLPLFKDLPKQAGGSGDLIKE